MFRANLSEILVLASILSTFIIIVISHMVGYSKGYDDGKEYQRKEIEEILEQYKKM